MGRSDGLNLSESIVGENCVAKRRFAAKSRLSFFFPTNSRRVDRYLSERLFRLATRSKRASSFAVVIPLSRANTGL